MNVEVLAEAEAEFDDAVEYYSLIRPQLAKDLVRRFKECLLNIERNAENHPQLETLDFDLDIRRAILKRFPYMIVFEIRLSEIRLLAFAHTASKPNYWIGRRKDS